MKSTHQKASDWGLILLGGLIVTLSQQIVPGLEWLLGIETIVGRDSVSTNQTALTYSPIRE